MKTVVINAPVKFTNLLDYEIAETTKLYYYPNDNLIVVDGMDGEVNFVINKNQARILANFFDNIADNMDNVE
jgi:hypothetical protein